MKIINQARRDKGREVRVRRRTPGKVNREKKKKKWNGYSPRRQDADGKKEAGDSQSQMRQGPIRISTSSSRGKPYTEKGECLICDFIWPQLQHGDGLEGLRGNLSRSVGQLLEYPTNQ